MALSDAERLSALEARVLEIEGKYEATLLKLDSDAGVTDTNYHTLTATKLVTNDLKTVTNVTNILTSGKGYMLQFLDVRGKRYTLKPQQVATGVVGVSAGLATLLAASKVTVV